MSEDDPSFVWKAMIRIDSQLAIMDVIRHEERFWLVPDWWQSTSAGWRMPDRIVAIDSMAHDHVPQNKDWQFLINNPVPKLVFEAAHHSQIPDGYEVAIRPNIRLQIPDA